MRTAWNLYTPDRQGVESAQAVAFHPFSLLQCSWCRVSQSLFLAISSCSVNHLGAIGSSEKCLLPTQMSSYLPKSVPQTDLTSNHIKLWLYKGRVCAQPEAEGGQLCWSMRDHAPVCIPNLSSSQHSQQLKEDLCKILVASKMKQTLLHGWVISITLWSVYAEFQVL